MTVGRPATAIPTTGIPIDCLVVAVGTPLHVNGTNIPHHTTCAEACRGVALAIHEVCMICILYAPAITLLSFKKMCNYTVSACSTDLIRIEMVIW